MTKRTLAVLTVAVLALGLGTPANAEPETVTPQQWRSYWVDGFNEGIYNPAQVTNLVEDAKKINANALIVQVGRRYDCFCNRALYPRTDAAIAPLPYDPLDEMITQGHAAGLEVHAWVNVNTMWNSATRPSSPEHVFNKHGQSATGSDRWLNKRHDGQELVGANAFMDPANPGAVNYIVSGIQSIVRQYDVDGINLDYVRYPDYSSTTTHSDWGYSETSLARFRAVTGRTDTPLPADPQFSDWRRAQMTNLVRKIYLGMWEVDRQARLSMDGITYSFGPQTMGGWEKTRPYTEVLQDWKGWMAEGIMDTVVAMNYKRNWMPDQKQMYDEWTEVLADWQGERQAVIGPALYLNDISDSVEQVRLALASTASGNSAAGWSGYSYANPTQAGVNQSPSVRSAERDRLAQALTTGPDAPFANKAAVPVMPWKASPTEGHISGRVTLRTGTPLDQVRVTLRPLTANGAPITRLADGDGWFGFVHLRPGVYQVQVDLPNGVVGQPIAVAKVRAGAVSKVDLTNLVQH
ncbi:family 10 glycosylhydrolase [Micromonospora sp. NPDC093277]|uniref:family 10 glycosylhydrolase n=1 Tax=Micromonospora sp. NPDC093277 TaxID=3364291 RepID=UPI003809D63E